MPKLELYNLHQIVWRLDVHVKSYPVSLPADI